MEDQQSPVNGGGQVDHTGDRDVVKLSSAVTLCDPEGSAPTSTEAHMSHTAPDPLTGIFLDGEFELIERIGEGGFGTVYKAIQHPIDRLVAIKLLKSEGLIQNLTTQGRFFREAKAIASLRSPHTVTLIKFNRTNINTGGGAMPVMYMALEYIDGPDLRSMVEARGPLDPALVRDLALDILDSLQEAHDQGIIHRDLKPENVLVEAGPDGRLRAKVLDFGIAKAIAEQETEEINLTQDGTMLGTPAYMAPEQFTRGDIGPFTDVYSLGMLLYTLLNGAPPYVGSTYSVMYAHTQAPPPPVPTEISERPLGTVLSRAMRKDPARRFPNAGMMRAALLNVSTDNALSPTLEAPRPLSNVPTLTDVDATPIPMTEALGPVLSMTPGPEVEGGGFEHIPAEPFPLGDEDLEEVSESEVDPDATIVPGEQPPLPEAPEDRAPKDRAPADEGPGGLIPPLYDEPSEAGTDIGLAPFSPPTAQIPSIHLSTQGDPMAGRGDPMLAPSRPPPSPPEPAPPAPPPSAKQGPSYVALALLTILVGAGVVAALHLTGHLSFGDDEPGAVTVSDLPGGSVNLGGVRLGCPKGMVAITPADVGQLFCIDTHEHPGPAKVPTEGISLSKARRLCAAEQKRLCTADEWIRACGAGRPYPYGQTFEPDRCRTAGAGLGDARPKCAGRFGTYDMSGGVAEWTADGVARGGDVSATAKGASCLAGLPAGATQGMKIGVRCCAAHAQR